VDNEGTLARLDQRADDWNVDVLEILETETSIMAFGKRLDQPVVLKLLRRPGDEWRSGEVLEAFDGKGIVRVLEHVEGALLIEGLSPATSLAGLTSAGRDDEATEVLADVIHRMSGANRPSKSFATVEDWGKGFERYLRSDDHQIPRPLVVRAGQSYFELCASQQETRLLHGDLQHYNVLFDNDRGWLAIDPKGVIGEVEYEIAPSLRNPFETPAFYTSPELVERRIAIYAERLNLNRQRILAWTFSQAVLSAIWSVEDQGAIDQATPAMLLAEATRLLVD
jgi:streptomycin 6-kinase